MKIKQFILILFAASFAFAQKAPSYYNSINFKLKGNALKTELADLIKDTHNRQLSYDQIWDVLKKSDLNPENNREVLLLYGNEASGVHARTRGVNRNGGGSSDWNREHTYAKSLGNPSLGTSGPGADAHHLRPADVSLNNQRGSLRFADGRGEEAFKTNGGWFPGDEWKGDVARMMMYMYVRYGNRCAAKNVGLGPRTYSSDFPDIFIKWNIEDPVSDFEKQRNNVVAEEQGNRNPFIDNPYLATLIWGGPEAQNAWPDSFGKDGGSTDNGSGDTDDNGGSVDDSTVKDESKSKSKEIIVYPNPIREHHIEKKIHIQGDNLESIKWLKIYDMQGNLLKHIVNPFIFGHEKSIDFTPYDKGFYIIQAPRFSKKIIIL